MSLQKFTCFKFTDNIRSVDTDEFSVAHDQQEVRQLCLRSLVPTDRPNELTPIEVAELKTCPKLIRCCHHVNHSVPTLAMTVIATHNPTSAASDILDEVRIFYREVHLVGGELCRHVRSLEQLL